MQSWTTVKKELFECVEEHVKRLHLLLFCFDECFGSRIYKRISFVKYNKIHNFVRFVTLNSVKVSISFLHNHFAIKTVVKASGNFAIICKKFYMSAVSLE